MTSVFDKQKVLRPSQLSVVAERRYRDAVALCDTGKNERATGAMYLAGFVIEILLKAQMLVKYPALGRANGGGILTGRTWRDGSWFG